MPSSKQVSIPIDNVTLPGDLRQPSEPTGVVVFAHGSGSSRKSPRNQFVADQLVDRGLATLLFDLLTEGEDRNRDNRFDIELLTHRLLGATEWVDDRTDIADLPVGYFGSSTGAASALRAAADRSDVAAVVSRGGRVDLATGVLDSVAAPTLLIVGGDDQHVLELNREVLSELAGPAELSVVEGAGHLFEGEGELESVAERAGEWFVDHLG